jgi:hypothetical protein
MAGPGPLSPEELRAYYAGQASTDPMMSAPPPMSPAASYYGPPAPPVAPPSVDVAALPNAPSGPPPSPGIGGPAEFGVRVLAPLLGPAASALGAAATTPAPAGPPVDAQGNPVSASEFKVGAQMSGPSPDEKPVALPFSKGGVRPGETASRVYPTVTEGAATKTGGAPGGGGSGNSDPYGVGKSRNALRQVAADEIGTTRKLGATEAAGALAVSEERTRLAREHSEDAAIEMETARFHRETIERHLNEASDQLDAVRSKKVDPLAYEKENGGHVMTVIGGLIGGLYQGLNKLDRNPFLDRFDRKVSESIALQERELSRKEKGVQDKVNLIGQLRNVYHDEELARQQARRMYYEAGLQAIEAKKGEYDAPAIIERAELGAEGLRGKMATQELAWGERAAAAAASAAAARRAEMWKEREFALKQEGAITDRIKATNEGNKRGHEDLTGISKALSDPKYLSAKKTVAELLPQVVDKDGNITKGVKGVGPGADARNAIFPENEGIARTVGRTIGGAAYEGARQVGKLDQEERHGRQIMTRLFDSYRVMVTGAGASTEELDRLKASFLGEGTPEEQATAVRQVQALVEGLEQNAGATDPEAYRQFTQNQQAVAGQQKAAAPVQREKP